MSAKRKPKKNKNNERNVNAIEKEKFNEMLQEHNENMKKEDNCIDIVLKEKDNEIDWLAK